MRLDKYLAQCNIGTRSVVKKLISSKRVEVNDTIVSDPAAHINEATDSVKLDGEIIQYKRYRYFLLNKPAGCVTATKDNVHSTVMEHLTVENLADCAPVGRLDIDTEGVLLITNDGELAHRLLSPKNHVEKTYFARLDKPCPPEAVARFLEGIDIGDKKPTLPAKLEALSEPNEARLTICEGRFHQVKRMFKAMGCEVIYLKRETFGPLNADGLHPGEYRELSESEIEELRSV